MMFDAKKRSDRNDIPSWFFIVLAFLCLAMMAGGSVFLVNYLMRIPPQPATGNVASAVQAQTVSSR